MIRVEIKPEPPAFEERVRARGRRWLAENPAPRRPPAYWREVRAELEAAFEGRCAYTAMTPMAPATVDHFVSIDEDRRLAYEWDNYRYSNGWVNSSKSKLRSHEILDPCQIGDDWFEIVLPTYELRVTERCPEALRERARSMLRRLRLDHGPEVVPYRRCWHDLHQKGLPLEELDKHAPLLARAIRKEQALRAETPT